MATPPITYLQPYINLIPGTGIEIEIDGNPDGGDNEITITATGGDAAAHIADALDAHDASAISLTANTAGADNVEDWVQVVEGGSSSIISAASAANGSIFYATGSSDWTELLIGSTGQSLVVVGGVPIWTDKLKYARMTSPGTTYTSNAALANVTGAAIAIGASEIWDITTTVQYSANTTGDIQFAFTWPASPTQAWWFGTSLFGTGASNDTNAIKNNVTTASGTGSSYGGSATIVGGEMKFFIINGTNAGSVQLQAAQSVSNGGATTLVDAIMVGRRLG